MLSLYNWRNMNEFYYYKVFKEKNTKSMLYELKVFPFGFIYTNGIEWDHKEIEISFLDTIRISFGITNPF